MSFTNEIWFAGRLDLDAGSGRRDDPYDTAAFDAVLAKYRAHGQSPLVIYMGPGNYPTAGIAGRQRNNTADILQPGWKLVGSGERHTIIKIVDFDDDVNPTSGVNIGLTNWYQDSDGIELHDFTVDCNYSVLASRRPNLGLAGVAIYGEGARVRNVRVINGAGLRVDQAGVVQENFLITAGGIGRNVEGVQIDGCEVEKIAGGYVSAIHLANASPAHWTSGLVRDCRVSMQAGNASQFGLNLLNAQHATFENNFVQDAARCFGNDSGDNRWLAIRNNTFLPDSCGAFVLSSRDSVFENNLIVLRKAGLVGVVAFSDPALGGEIANWLFRNNVIRAPGGVEGYGFHTQWTGGPSPSGLTFEQNFVDSHLLNVYPPYHQNSIGTIEPEPE